MDREVVVDCPRCEGDGVVPDPDADDFTLDIECPACLGEGWLDVNIEE